MAIDMQPESDRERGREPSGREPDAPLRPARPWWRRPAIHTALVGAVLGYLLGHLLGNIIASGYSQVQNAGQNDYAIVLGYVFGPAGARQRGGARGVDRPGQVLPVLAGPQGGGHPVPGRHDRLLPDRRPAGHGDQDRAAVALVPRLQFGDVHRDRRRARHDDDDDDELDHPRATRELPAAADDRVQADGVPADRGAVLLADPGGLHRAAVRPDVRRVPVRLDRVRAAFGPGYAGRRRLRRRIRDHGNLADP